MHHLFVGDALARFPDARLHLVPGLAKKRPDLPAHAELSEAPIDDALTQLRLDGMPGLSEVALLHRPSRTLVLCDLFFHFVQSPSWLTRSYLKLSGAWGGLGQTLVQRSLVKDRAALRRSYERLLELDFDRLVVSHGQVLEAGAKEALRAAISR